jgi:hypothetical protein
VIQRDVQGHYCGELGERRTRFEYIESPSADSRVLAHDG